MRNSNELKKRGIISVYKKMLKENTIKQNGPAYHRMRQLERQHIKETRWLRSRLEDDESVSFSWLKEDQN
mgnify:FL=1|jgi:hypothetical protein|tara:strand:- start:121 stop:330 length:210 start_codon:yes stop_codon:yes gene_type:complete